MISDKVALTLGLVGILGITGPAAYNAGLACSHYEQMQKENSFSKNRLELEREYELDRDGALFSTVWALLCGLNVIDTYRRIKTS